MATGKPETNVARDWSWFYLEVYRLVIVPCGIMTQIAQKRLYFKIGGASATENDTSDIYLDIAAALTAVNRKQYHQFTKSGDPLCYTVTLTCLTASKPVVACTAANTWTTANAAKKTAVGWKTQLKNSNIRMSELPTYARRFRCGFDSGMVASGAGQQSLENHLVPDGCDGTRLFTAYDAPDGTSIDYFNSNEVALLALVDGADDYKPVLMGASDPTTQKTFGMISEYLLSRRNMREESDPTTEFPSFGGLMNTLFATSEELADDVTKAAAEYNIARPYSEENSYESVLAAYTVSGTTNYTETFSAPLGLIKFVGEFGLVEDAEFIIDVEAVYEM